MRTFRDLAKKITPWWFRRGQAERFFYAIGLMFDGLADTMIQALKLRYPGSNTLFLPYHATERRLRQGLYESDADFAVRLAKFFEAHHDRGGPYAMLEQVYQHYRPNNFPVVLLYENGTAFTLGVDGTITPSTTALTTTDDWAHWTLVYFWPVDNVGDGTWDDPGTWDTDPAGVWDFGTMLATEAQDLRLIPTEWNAAHCNGTLLLLGPNDALWDYPVEPWDSADTWDDGSPPLKIEIY